ncbi:nucleotidyl transferase AbiEii/AbiGii toxin family protein [Edaphobacter modestus]|uniref:Nucleotidyltransferase AbiEii toxin of type IV toxin-antitoxin system n=1 Tax=Edaphobacter modestus TaxID=388466 RepID=A0A4Q7YGV9_9BACT|nr:nucleotidyl transferase AbiEii/AbiGii toxin family protein [Edaphobacter modestus]RZU35579.1 hypothetical protein BDD14_5649 [Edaphobacter modestus]
MNKIATMSRADRQALFAETANRMGVTDTIAEKDFWVCWVLQQLFTLEAFRDRLLFKGGTSLSKVFGVIRRFSEDIDLAVDFAALGFTGDSDPRQAGLSRTKREAILGEMLTVCRAYIGTEFIDALRARCSDVLGPEGEWTLSVEPGMPDNVLFRYPAAAATHDYIAGRVVLELGTHAEFVPHGSFTIRSFVADQFPDLVDEPDIRVEALLAKRTFWEKATILHAEFYRSPEKPLPPRYSRHYYDLAMMANSDIRDEALSDMGLLADVVRHKQVFYAATWARYDLAQAGSLRLLPAESRRDALKQDYRQMMPMIFGDAPAFEAILRTLAALEELINR